MHTHTLLSSPVSLGGHREGGDVEGDGGTQQLHNGGYILWLSAGRREGTSVLHTRLGGHGLPLL